MSIDKDALVDEMSALGSRCMSTNKDAQEVDAIAFSCSLLH